jgi:hypothetical protein
MTPLDDELRNLLKRQEPPEGFAERVLTRLQTAPLERNLLRRTVDWWRRPALRWAAALAACLLVMVGVARYQHQQRVRAQAEQASREAMLALRITSVELEAALERAQRVTVQALTAPQNPRREME